MLLLVLFAVVLTVNISSCSTKFPTPLDLLPDFSGVENSVCRKHGIAFSKALNSFTMWAVQMFDASAKYPVGILASNGYSLGSFDSCLAVSAKLDTGEKLQGQYCLVDVYFRHNFTLTLPPHFSLDYDPMTSAWNKLRDTGDPSQVRRDMIHWAVCVPASCSPADTQHALLQTVARLQTTTSLHVHIHVRSEMCQTQTSVLSRLQFNSADIFVVILSIILMLLVITGSVYDEIHHMKDTPTSTTKNCSSKQCYL
ncbi:hypothetical protein J6590_061768 [Homalodisca vitripennis]|nr:hypothetical protein J6590_061768 [Homalodisca vitripennis]